MQKIRVQRILKTLAFLTVLLVVSVSLIPYGVKFGIKKVIEDKGAENVIIDDIDFNPFTAKFQIHKLKVSRGGADQLIVPNMSLEFSWLSLFHKRIFIEDLKLADCMLLINKPDANTLHVAGIPVPISKSYNKEDKTEWNLGIGEMKILSTKVRILSPDENMNIDIHDIRLSDLKSWVNGHYADVMVRAGVFISAESKPDRLTMSVGRLEWNGKVSFVRRKTIDRLDIIGNLITENLSVEAPEKGLRLIGIKKLFISNIEVDDFDKIDIPLIQIAGLTIGDELIGGNDTTDSSKPFLYTSVVTVSDLKVRDKSKLSTPLIAISGLNVYLRRDVRGGLYVVKNLSDIIRSQFQSGERKKENNARVRISKLNIKDDSSITFEDASVSPVFVNTLTIEEATVTDIVSDSASQQSPFSVSGLIGDYASLNLTGIVIPFSKQPTLKTEGNIREFDLAALSPYTSKLLGYNFTSGHLDAEIKIDIFDGEIKGENDIVIRKLRAAALDKERIKELNAEVKMPLETALSLLRDKNNTIRFRLPIHGDIENPEFDFGNIINRAVANAVKEAAETYLKIAFQPYGALITVIEIAGKASRLRLDPVYFPAGSSSLGEDMIDYLDKVAGIMKERPKIEISLCGKVTDEDMAKMFEAISAGRKKAGEKVKTSDREIPQEQKLKLAKDRALAIKDHLVQKHSIESGRLFICNPAVDSDKDAMPRVDLLI